MIEDYLQKKYNYWKGEVIRIQKDLDPNDPWDELSLGVAHEELEQYARLLEVYKKEKR